MSATLTLTPERLAELVEIAIAPIAARVAALEARAPIPGRDGRDGLPGIAGPPGSDGAPGAPGANGTLEELGVTFDGQRTIAFVVKTTGRELGAVRLPIVLDRGVYKSGEGYELGDLVSHAGSMWIAQTTPPTGKPGEAGSGWRLSVKRS
jgi:hypothetical protein